MSYARYVYGDIVPEKNVKEERLEFGREAELLFSFDNQDDWTWVNSTEDSKGRFDFKSKHNELTLDIKRTRHADSDLRLYNKHLVPIDERGKGHADLFMFYRLNEPVGWISWNNVIYALIKGELDRSEEYGYYRIPESLITKGFPPA